MDRSWRYTQATFFVIGFALLPFTLVQFTFDQFRLVATVGAYGCLLLAALVRSYRKDIQTLELRIRAMERQVRELTDPVSAQADLSFGSAEME